MQEYFKLRDNNEFMSDAEYAEYLIYGDLDVTGGGNGESVSPTPTGITAPGRFVGVTTAGAPATGTFSVGDFVITQNGNMWVCVTAGSPGSWTSPVPTSDLLAVGEETIPRLSVSGQTSLGTGQLRQTYFTARKTETISQVRTITANAAAGATYCRIGVYDVAANGDISIIASTPDDTTLWSAAYTVYTSALSAPFQKVAGKRYAVALIFNGTTAPTMYRAANSLLNSEGLVAPVLHASHGTSALQPSLTSSQLTVSSSNSIYSVLLP